MSSNVEVVVQQNTEIAMLKNIVEYSIKPQPIM